MDTVRSVSRMQSFSALLILVEGLSRLTHPIYWFQIMLRFRPETLVLCASFGRLSMGRALKMHPRTHVFRFRQMPHRYNCNCIGMRL